MSRRVLEDLSVREVGGLEGGGRLLRGGPCCVAGRAGRTPAPLARRLRRGPGHLELAVGSQRRFPSRAMADVVVVAAEEDEVVESRSAAVLPVLHVVCLAPTGPSVA